MKLILLTFTFYTFFSANGRTLKVTDQSGTLIDLAMVTERLKNPAEVDTSDGGYPKANMTYKVVPEVTKFTSTRGVVEFEPRQGDFEYRIRKFGYKDLIVHKTSQTIILDRELDPNVIAESKPSNVWLGALEIGTKEDKIHFQMQCGFCHQQGSEFTRMERTEEEWKEVISRMVRYGSRLPSDLQDRLGQTLPKNYGKLIANPGLLVNPIPLEDNLTKVTIREWPIGDQHSQTHDMLVAKNKLIYVADNIQDRLYEVDPITNKVTVYKIPHLPGEPNGGLIAARLKDFPSHDSTSNAHSLAESGVDGHIFITPSAQRRLVEFDPTTKKFTLHEMSEGMYPHTIRIDHNDEVWFTLALSNQVARFNRQTKKFRYYDLPARSLKEKIVSKSMYWIFKLMNLGVPLANLLKIDRFSTGVPLVYGIDITPDGMVWVARLHSREIGRIDPKTHDIKMIKTPFYGPRRLRTDDEGNLWIAAFGSSLISRYTPKTNSFDLYDIPVNPKGSETPYSLNVDRPRKKVWVNGNQSNNLFVFDIEQKGWTYTIPFPRKITFSRDVEFDQKGTAYTANSNFPSWHIEDSQPTLIEVKIDSN